MKRFDNKSGFTLIEIIVVLIIVGILAAIALPNLFSNVTKSRGAEALTEIDSIRPNIETCLAQQTGTEGNCTFSQIFPSISQPTSPNFTYVLATDPTNTGYTITATGTNAATGGTITLGRSDAADGASLGTISCTGQGTMSGAC